MVVDVHAGVKPNFVSSSLHDAAVPARPRLQRRRNLSQSTRVLQKLHPSTKHGEHLTKIQTAHPRQQQC